MNKSILVVIILLALCISGCTQNNQITSGSSSALTSESSAISADELSSQSDNDEPSSSSEQEDTSVESETSTAPDYQGLTQEQWQILQDQKELYGDLTTFEKGQAQFNGNIDCNKFTHLWWEHLIDNTLINHVGANEFESWLKELRSIDNPEHCNIYILSKQFSITLEELVSLIETNHLTHIYDLETVKRRYEYFAQNPQTEAEIFPTAPTYRNGLTKKQWQKLQDQKELYESLTTEEERENAVFLGKIDCLNFEHLYWEHWVGVPFGTHYIDYVGADKFNEWKAEQERTGQCVDCYSYAQHFSIDVNEFLSYMKENNMNYDFETLERRYKYYMGDPQE